MEFHNVSTFARDILVVDKLLVSVNHTKPPVHVSEDSLEIL